MLEVTTRAREKLQEALLEEKSTTSQVSYRITPIPSMPNRLGIALDREKKGDQVVKSKEGLKVLLVQADLAEELEGMILDYQETPNGQTFTINKITTYTTGWEKKRWN